MEIKTNNQILGHWIIYGKFYAKKNSSNSIWNHYTKKLIRTTSANYKGWENDAMKQLGMCTNGKFVNDKNRVKNIDFPVILKCYFYNYDNRTRDLSNYLEGIQDLLVKAEILKDDNFKIIIGHDGSRMFTDKENPRIEFWILKANEN